MTADWLAGFVEEVKAHHGEEVAQTAAEVISELQQRDLKLVRENDQGTKGIGVQVVVPAIPWEPTPLVSHGKTGTIGWELPNLRRGNPFKSDVMEKQLRERLGAILGWTCRIRTIRRPPIACCMMRLACPLCLRCSIGRLPACTGATAYESRSACDRTPGACAEGASRERCRSPDDDGSVRDATSGSLLGARRERRRSCVFEPVGGFTGNASPLVHRMRSSRAGSVAAAASFAYWTHRSSEITAQGWLLPVARRQWPCSLTATSSECNRVWMIRLPVAPNSATASISVSAATRFRIVRNRTRPVAKLFTPTPKQAHLSDRSS